jgi:hypothetical protein
MKFSDSSTLISTILKHDKKINTYKFALLRAINDVVLSFLDIQPGEKAVAIPLRMLAEYWFAYYYPFCDPQHPIQQGTRFIRNERQTQDMEFRGTLAAFRELWQTNVGNDPADGFFLIQEFRLVRSQTQYPPSLLKAYKQAVKAIVGALENPIRYSGPAGQQWSVFPKPQPFHTFVDVIAMPGTQPADMCLILSGELWEGFQVLSLWIEALCIHEWSLFVDKVDQDAYVQIDRGDVYKLLTARPDNRRPLTWERNHIEVLLMQGHTFTCPWTQLQIRSNSDFDLDHLIPLALYPTNALWNLVPADRKFNQQTKRDRLPKLETLERAKPHLALAYTHYTRSPILNQTLIEDTALRFTTYQRSQSPDELALLVTRFMRELADARNVAQF